MEHLIVRTAFVVDREGVATATRLRLSYRTELRLIAITFFEADRHNYRLRQQNPPPGD